MKRWCLAVGFWGVLAALALGSRAAETGEPAGTVRVYSDPAGARLWVDGVEAGDLTPVEVEVLPGPHELRLSLDDYDDRIKEVEVREGKEIEWRVRMKPVAERAAADRGRGLAGGYVSGGGAWVHLTTSDLTLGLDRDYEVNLRDKVSRAEGIALQVRYVEPIAEWGFVIVDAGYQDARFRLANLDLQTAGGPVRDDYRFTLTRGQLGAALGLNVNDYLIPYLGGGLHYAVLSDADETGVLGPDSQEAFMGCDAKAGLIVSTRAHLFFTLEYQYHWAYALEDFTFTAQAGYQF